MTLSFARRMERGADRRALVRHSLRRGATIFLIGLLLNGFPYFHLSTLRIPGVLQRIGLCYAIAACIFLYTSLRGQAAALIGVLASYWVLMTLVPVPGHGAGVFEKDANFSNWVDRLVLSGHMYSHTRTWDPEGIVSTLPAIGTALFGILAGHVLRSAAAPARKVGILMGSGAALFFTGEVLSFWMPINKSLWTVPYAVLMAGLASFVLGLCYFIIDVKGWRRWARPFAIYGSNAIVVYVLAGALARLLLMFKVLEGGVERMSVWQWIFRHVFLPVGDPYLASLLFALSFVALLYLAAYGMHRKGWYVRV